MTQTYDINEILNILPHRFPFLLVDRVSNLKPWNWVETYKNISFNEHFFQGHFPQKPVMPGVLILEAIAQSAALALGLSNKYFPEEIPEGINIIDFKDKIAYFASCDKVKFRRQVIPGDRLDIKVEFLRLGSRAWKVKGLASVSGEKAAEAELTAALS